MVSSQVASVAVVLILLIATVIVSVTLLEKKRPYLSFAASSLMLFSMSLSTKIIFGPDGYIAVFAEGYRHQDELPANDLVVAFAIFSLLLAFVAWLSFKYSNKKQPSPPASPPSTSPNDLAE